MSGIARPPPTGTPALLPDEISGVAAPRLGRSGCHMIPYLRWVAFACYDGVSIRLGPPFLFAPGPWAIAVLLLVTVLEVRNRGPLGTVRATGTARASWWATPAWVALVTFSLVPVIVGLAGVAAGANSGDSAQGVRRPRRG